jgi:predicted dehydrogenase/threonine dehydrogenase-like Zn-dependent dehydrogenase
LLQILQHRKTGVVSTEDLPAAKPAAGTVLVRNAFSLVSAGTERAIIEGDQGSLLHKARSRPDLVRQVVDNVRREGAMATFRKVQDKLDTYRELGYSCAGEVIESAVDDLRPGDLVACGGAGYASHAEMVCVPRRLVVRVPEGVGLDEAAYTTVAAIAIQGVRQADVRVGEHVVVIGLGLIGLITVQLLKASGCRVIGLDVTPRSFDLARALGCDTCLISDESAIREIGSLTHTQGADAVVITAATESSQPVVLAMQCARKRGVVVVVGAVAMEIPRSPFYQKEIDFRISCSYGPGRYDPDYEEGGHDYPFAFVRWTENRNMESVLDLMAQRKLDVAALTTHRIPVTEAQHAYDLITGKTEESYLGVLIQYPPASQPGPGVRRRDLRTSATPTPAGKPVLGFIGAGSFAQAMLLPPLVRLGVRRRGLVASKPLNAKTNADKFGFEYCATDAAEVISDTETNLVFIASRHDSHARYVEQALRAGKGVFVEKPPAINDTELQAIVDAYTEAQQRGSTQPFLMVGYNRRFSEPVIAMQHHFAGRNEPLAMHYRVNAGFIPVDHWAQHADQGGRIIGEGGHFIDVLQFLCGAVPTSVYAVGPADTTKRYNTDNVLISMTFADGSAGTIHYLANGSKAVEKEYLEVAADGKTARMWNFEKLECSVEARKTMREFAGDKGHAAEMKATVSAFEAGAGSPIRIESLWATSRATFAVLESLRTGLPVSL